MLYTPFQVGGSEYKLRLTASSLVALEKQFGDNPLNRFLAGEDKVPEFTVVIALLHAALQPLEHKITTERAYEIYDQYIEDGNTFPDAIALLVTVLSDSGIIPKSKTEEATEKNAELGAQ